MSLPPRSVGEEATGFVLAGGRSSRMGSDKALVELQGEPLIAHALRLLRQVGLPAAIAGGHSGLELYAPVVADRAFPGPAGSDSGAGPLGGICAALASTQAANVLFLSVDMPLLPVELLSLMLEDARLTSAGVVVVSVHGFAETFPTLVSRELLPALDAELQKGNDGCFSALRAAAATTGRPFRVLAVENLVQCGRIGDSVLPAAAWFLNVNRPGDLERAGSLLRPSIA